jgi:hypothetical protein
VIPPLAIAVVVAAMILPNSASAHRTPFYWTLPKAMGKIDGERVRVGPRVVGVRAATTLCSGQGDRVRRARTSRWRHFGCTYAAFAGALPGRDIEFRLHVLGRERFVITDARWVV